jgi:hypothetical protein
MTKEFAVRPILWGRKDVLKITAGRTVQGEKFFALKVTN